LVTAWVPFEASNITGVMMKHLSERPVEPSQRRPDLALPPQFDQLVMKALAKHPNDRFQTMGEVKDAINKLIEAIGGGAIFTPPSGVSMPAVLPEKKKDTIDPFAATRASKADGELAGAIAEFKRGEQPPAGSKTGLLAGLAALGVALGGAGFWFA